jgi:hypothetical protein
VVDPATEPPVEPLPESPAEPPAEPLQEAPPAAPKPPSPTEPWPNEASTSQPEVPPAEQLPPTEFVGPPLTPSVASATGPRTDDPVGEGEVTDMESDPTSLQDVPPNQWRNGRPIASKGLEIKTRKPRFTILTLVTSAPRNPIVELRFDQEGKPVRYGFVRPSGYPDIDGPILDALAGWRAAGEPLKRLGPDDTITLRFKLLLNR